MQHERLSRELRVWKQFFRDMVQEAAHTARKTVEELRTRYHLIRLREELRDRYAQLGERFFESLEKDGEEHREEIEALVREIYEYRELIRDLESMLRSL